MTDHDPWGGTSGLLDDYEGVIDSFKFVYDSDYNSGQTLIARVEITPDEGEEQILKLSTGSGWEDDEKGTKAKLESGKEPKGFSKSSNIQRFFAGAAETEFLATMKETVPWDGTIWAGHRFKFHRITYKGFGENKDKDYETTVPYEYLGPADDKKPARKASSKSSEKKGDADEETPAARAKRLAAEKKAAKESEGGDELEGDIAKLAALAKECDTHEEFIEKAYADESIDADANEDKIVDDAFYNEHHG